MEEVCPLCNGIINIKEKCPRCGNIMDDIGKIEDYFGPYSPYMGKDIFTLNNDRLFIGDQQCVHMIECGNCRYLDFKSFNPVCL